MGPARGYPLVSSTILCGVPGLGPHAAQSADRASTWGCPKVMVTLHVASRVSWPSPDLVHRRAQCNLVRGSVLHNFVLGSPALDPMCPTTCLNHANHTHRWNHMWSFAVLGCSFLVACYSGHSWSRIHIEKTQINWNVIRENKDSKALRYHRWKLCTNLWWKSHCDITIVPQRIMWESVMGL